MLKILEFILLAKPLESLKQVSDIILTMFWKEH